MLTCTLVGQAFTTNVKTFFSCCWNRWRKTQLVVINAELLGHVSPSLLTTKHEIDPVSSVKPFFINMRSILLPFKPNDDNPVTQRRFVNPMSAGLNHSIELGQFCFDKWHVVFAVCPFIAHTGVIFYDDQILLRRWPVRANRIIVISSLCLPSVRMLKSNFHSFTDSVSSLAFIFVIELSIQFHIPISHCCLPRCVNRVSWADQFHQV